MRPTITNPGPAVAGALLSAAALIGASPASAAVDFANPPATLPASNGALIRTEPMKLGASVQIPFVTALPGKATKIMYRSTDTNGAPVAVTGTYIEPSKRWANGPRPLVTFAEGTQGQGDGCAPSKTLESPLALGSGSIGLGYEVPVIYGLLNRGIAVVITDYMGLGTADRIHTYVNRVDQGHAVLDAARAALQLPGTSISAASPVGAFGYSQGGGASASAAELASSYAPDVNLKAAYAGAPPADLQAVMTQADGTILTAVIGYAVNGFVATYPSLKPILDAETTAAGKAALAKISGQCVADSITSFAFAKTKQWTTSGKSISEIAAGSPQILSVIDAQRIGRIKPQVPVRVVTGTQDDIVPHGQVKQLALDWCSRGASVDYQPVVQLFPSFGTSVNHLGPGLLGASESLDWMADRMAGKPAANNCASVSRMP